VKISGALLLTIYATTYILILSFKAYIWSLAIQQHPGSSAQNRSEENPRVKIGIHLARLTSLRRLDFSPYRFAL